MGPGMGPAEVRTFKAKGLEGSEYDRIEKLRGIILQRWGAKPTNKELLLIAVNESIAAAGSS